MHGARTTLPLLLMAIPLLVASCDGHEPAGMETVSGVYPVQAHHLTLEVCEAQEQTTWSLDFGLTPDEGADLAPLEWPGSYRFTMLGESSGAGGGGVMRTCGGSHGPTPCEVAPEQQRARSWRISRTLDMAFVPREFQLKLTAMPGHQPDRFGPGGPVLDLRFELGEPEDTHRADCVTIPVQSVRVSRERLDIEGD
ncbi:MAG: hypothetical protein QF464_00680 [Myxococcota bacterium]|nr:hypothetical protein [Myxococcota bacterium]